MSQIFRIRGTDKRQSYIARFDAEEPFTTQKAAGKSVEVFHPDYGFLLLDEDHLVNFKQVQSARVRSVAELSLGPQLELREFYYTLRGKPELVRPFQTTANIYAAVLASINDLEVFCDVKRSSFTVGNLPRGFIHYGHSYDYGRAETPIGFTENIARGGIAEHEIRHAQNIIHMEKMAASTRLVSMGFSKLTNSVITTTGGNFTRAVYELANRFHDKKHMTFFCDGDAFGNDMLRALEFGTMASRHLTLDQAFSQKKNPLVHIAGLFPSVAEQIGLPNDVEQKRPMSNPAVKKRVEFLQRYDLVDGRDLDTWERDKTYELEAMSTKYTNPAGEPVGLGIYLTEYMRINDIPCKPQPTKDDDRLVDAFRGTVENSFENQLTNAVAGDSPTYDLQELIEKKITEITDRIATELREAYFGDVMEKAEAVTADQIREKLLLQYQENPEREIFSLEEVADELVYDFQVNVEWDPEDLKAKVEKSLEDYVYNREGSIYSEEIEFQDLPEPEEKLRPFYDVVEEAIGADPDDCEEVRKALEWRLS